MLEQCKDIVIRDTNAFVENLSYNVNYGMFEDIPPGDKSSLYLSKASVTQDRGISIDREEIYMESSMSSKIWFDWGLYEETMSLFYFTKNYENTEYFIQKYKVDQQKFSNVFHFEFGMSK